jgi:putative ATP-dependent endonuclease of OLD family
MEFKSISIKNFRNFEYINITLNNKNVFFGLNDVGKTNFLYALRYVFDKSVRKNNLQESDFYKHNIENDITILVTIDISETEDDNENIENNLLRSRMKGAIYSDSTIIYIKFEGIFKKDEQEALQTLYWGSDLEHLEEIQQRSNSYAIDDIINVIYIDSYVNLNYLFKKNIKALIDTEDKSNPEIISSIKESYDSINTNISNLKGIHEFELQLTNDYKRFTDDNININVRSELANNDLYSNLVPYIQKNGDENLYPTSGEGRKKLLAYSIYDILALNFQERKINLFMIEEPENNLHRSMQIALSNTIFNNSKYKFLFATTHSPFILYEMDNINLIRIYNNDKINTASNLFKIPKDYSNSKEMLNRNLSEAIFADRVLLVEGPSELVLFRKVLNTVNPLFESKGGYILDVGGIGFNFYYSILTELKISTIIKTDNDLRIPKGKDEFTLLGFRRVKEYSKNNELPINFLSIKKKIIPQELKDKPIKDYSKTEKITIKRNLYESYKDKLDEIRADKNIFLSKVDLENDLDEVIHDILIKYIKTNQKEKDNEEDSDSIDSVEYLQKAKKNHMVELVKNFTQDDCIKIYNSYNFECLKRI